MTEKNRRNRRNYRNHARRSGVAQVAGVTLRVRGGDDIHGAAGSSPRATGPARGHDQAHQKTVNPVPRGTNAGDCSADCNQPTNHIGFVGPENRRRDPEKTDFAARARAFAARSRAFAGGRFQTRRLADSQDQVRGWRIWGRSGKRLWRGRWPSPEAPRGAARLSSSRSFGLSSCGIAVFDRHREGDQVPALFVQG